MIDWSEYYLNLTEANAAPDQPTQWKTLYASVLEEYGMKVQKYELEQRLGIEFFTEE